MKHKKWIVLVVGIALITTLACGPCGWLAGFAPRAQPRVVEKIVKETVIVEKEVEVEKIVKETVVVEKEVEVTVEVEKEVEVEVEKVVEVTVEVEKVVTATPEPTSTPEPPPTTEGPLAKICYEAGAIPDFPEAAETLAQLIYVPCDECVTIEEFVSQITPRWGNGKVVGWGWTRERNDQGQFPVVRVLNPWLTMQNGWIDDSSLRNACGQTKEEMELRGATSGEHAGIPGEFEGAVQGFTYFCKPPLGGLQNQTMEERCNNR